MDDVWRGLSFWNEFYALPATCASVACVGGLGLGLILSMLTRFLPRRVEAAWHTPAGGASARADEPTDLSWRSLRQDFSLDRRAAAIALATALVFAACAWRFGPTRLALYGMGLSAVLLALAWIDAETGLLPDALTLPLVWAGLLANLRGGLAELPSAVLGAVAAYLFLWALCGAFRLLARREGMGGGDLKLAAALGAWFGVGALPWLLLVASLAGAAVGLGLRAAGRAGPGQTLPFGPYLAASGILMLLAAAPWPALDHF